MELAIYSGQTMSGLHGAQDNTSGHASIFTLITLKFQEDINHLLHVQTEK